MQDLTITLVQTELFWENAAANREHFGQKLAALTVPTDLVVLPEMFSTGFSMRAGALAETMDGETVAWLAEQAKLYNTVITGSLIIAEAGNYYNRLIWMQPDGTCYYYDKRHLFRMAQEHQTYAGGGQKLITELNGWRVCPLICYDLRFPVWGRNIQNSYDLLLYTANWPAKRSLAWKTLLPARAIENLAYCAGLNRVGTDANNIAYSGDSAVYSPTGEVLWQSQQEEVHTLTLSKKALEEYRKIFPAYLDADNFELR